MANKLCPSIGLGTPKHRRALTLTGNLIDVNGVAFAQVLGLAIKLEEGLDYLDY